jgi:hypothetical protein
MENKLLSGPNTPIAITGVKILLFRPLVTIRDVRDGGSCIVKRSRFYNLRKLPSLAARSRKKGV